MENNSLQPKTANKFPKHPSTKALNVQAEYLNWGKDFYESWPIVFNFFFVKEILNKWGCVLSFMISSTDSSQPSVIISINCFEFKIIFLIPSFQWTHLFSGPKSPITTRRTKTPLKPTVSNQNTQYWTGTRQAKANRTIRVRSATNWS